VARQFDSRRRQLGPPGPAAAVAAAAATVDRVAYEAAVALAVLTQFFCHVRRQRPSALPALSAALRADKRDAAGYAAEATDFSVASSVSVSASASVAGALRGDFPFRRRRGRHGRSAAADIAATNAVRQPQQL
jgi:hypothetical protein